MLPNSVDSRRQSPEFLKKTTPDFCLAKSLGSFRQRYPIDPLTREPFALMDTGWDGLPLVNWIALQVLIGLIFICTYIEVLVTNAHACSD